MFELPRAQYPLFAAAALANVPRLPRELDIRLKTLKLAI